ncbi:MAG: hypothetical protein PHQ27_07300 [Victivallales bacterium]|nr:hypothetical protein [Victivallales bacterium]
MSIKKKILISIPIILLTGLGYSLVQFHTKLEKRFAFSEMVGISSFIGEYVLEHNDDSRKTITSFIANKYRARMTPNGALADRWGTPYNIKILKVADTVIVLIISAGPDKKFMTNDDISTYDKWQKIHRSN